MSAAHATAESVIVYTFSVPSSQGRKHTIDPSEFVTNQGGAILSSSIFAGVLEAQSSTHVSLLATCVPPAKMRRDAARHIRFENQYAVHDDRLSLTYPS